MIWIENNWYSYSKMILNIQINLDFWIWIDIFFGYRYSNYFHVFGGKMNELKLCDETFWACFLDWWKEDFEWFSSQKESIVDFKFLIRKLEKKREIGKERMISKFMSMIFDWMENNLWKFQFILRSKILKFNNNFIACFSFFFGMNSFFWIEILTVCYLIECEIPRKVSIQLNEIFEKIFSIHFFSNSKFFLMERDIELKVCEGVFYLIWEWFWKI